MAALEAQLQNNIEPLIRWTSQKEFTAENVVFLKAVRDYKRKWDLRARETATDPLLLRERFEEAAVIYFALVNPNTARFNVNLEYRIFDELADMFKGVVYEPCVNEAESGLSTPRTENVITPWTDLVRPAAGPVLSEQLTYGVDEVYPSPITEISKEGLGGDYAIPPNFDIDVFNKAYDSIKYLVFTNSWVR
jgi:hypothetical protein